MRGRRQCDDINGCGEYYDQDATECSHCGLSANFSELTPFDKKHIIYDLESYPNFFSASFKHPLTGNRQFFEVSTRKNQMPELWQFLLAAKHNDLVFIGFNNIGYDYPLLHLIFMHHGNIDHTHLYAKGQSIISTPWNDRFQHVIWDNKTHIKQLDLSKIHHFDNKSRQTSLKMLEFNMRSNNIQELPIKPCTVLTPDEMNIIGTYNDHDVDETEQFYIHTIDMINFREELSKKYNHSFMNANDTKIGKDFFAMELERLVPGSCYRREGRRKIKRQTIRESIDLSTVIFPYIKLINPEFARVQKWLSQQTITETKGVFKKLIATVDGIDYKFGVGGIHASIESSAIYSDDDYVLYDWDVKSYYPNLAIVNNLYPEHLGVVFCKIYHDLYLQRLSHKKGTTINDMLKLALNGVYGDSNSMYSPFFDSKYMMAITINGQLLLCLLIEQLRLIPGLEMIQANTDGVTVKVRRDRINDMTAVCDWWQEYTCLTLEHAVYKRMFINSVNDYIAEYENGNVKRIGDYEYNLDWHQNHSYPIVAKAAEQVLIHGANVGDYIRQHDNIHDFMLRTKVNKSDELYISGDKNPLQKITRYYVSNDGGSMTKIAMPAKDNILGTWKRASKLTDQYYKAVLKDLASKTPSPGTPLDIQGTPWDERINTKNLSRYKIAKTSIQAGHLVTPCNNINDARWDNINFDYYINETKKLISFV